MVVGQAHQITIFSLLNNFQCQIFPLLTVTVSNIHHQCFMPLLSFKSLGFLMSKSRTENTAKLVGIMFWKKPNPSTQPFYGCILTDLCSSKWRRIDWDTLFFNMVRITSLKGKQKPPFAFIVGLLSHKLCLTFSCQDNMFFNCWSRP